MLEWLRGFPQNLLWAIPAWCLASVVGGLLPIALIQWAVVCVAIVVLIGLSIAPLIYENDKKRAKDMPWENHR